MGPDQPLQDVREAPIFAVLIKFERMKLFVYRKGL